MILFRSLGVTLLALGLTACQTTASLSDRPAQSSASPGASSPATLGERFLTYYDAGDVDGLMTLYEDGAVFPTRDSTYTGPAEIRGVLQGYLDSGLELDFHEQAVFVSGELALIQNRWTVPGTDFSGVTTEVARRQPDGTWKYVFDSPYGAELVR